MSGSVFAQWGKYYVKRGWKLIPIHVLVNGQCSCGQGQVCWDKGNAGKHPVTRDWNNPLTAIQTDMQVDRQWGENVALQYSMGLLCGQPSKVWVLDIDPRNGGYESLEELEAEIGVLPDTLRARTGGGGMHIFFALPAGLILKKGPLHKDLPGIDVQAEGSQIVLSPSIHRSGTRYTWETPVDTPLAEAPEPLINLIKGSRGSSSATGPGGTGVDLDKLMKEGVPDGSRNDTMYKVACKYARQFGVDTDEQKRLVIGAIRTFNDEFVKPPLDITELLTLSRSAIDFIAANPSTKDIDPAVMQWLESRQAKQPEPSTDGDDDVPATPEPEPDAGTTAEVDADTPETAQTAGDGVDGPPPVDDDASDGGGDDDDGALPPDVDDPFFGVPGGRSESDLGNARRIADYFGENIRYTDGRGWYYWDDKRGPNEPAPTMAWKHDGEGHRVQEAAKSLPQYIASELANMPMAQAAASTLLDWAQKSRDGGRIAKAVKLATSDRRINVPADAWDSNPYWLGVRNGVIDLETGKLMKPERHHYITKRTAVEFDPRIRDTRFQIFLDQVTNHDKELQVWLQRVVGYTLTGQTNEQKFFLVYGPPGSGKSTILEIVRAMLGTYAYSLPTEFVVAQRGMGSNSADQYTIAEMHGRRMLALSELPEGELLKEDMVKRITGGDTMTGRVIMKQPFTFTPVGKLWIATNFRPRVKDAGIWRRMQAIPFEFIPPAPDRTLKPYLQDPRGGLPAVLAWAVEGARMWCENPAGIGTCTVVEEATREYKEQEDELGQFIDEELRQGEGLQIAVKELHGRYELWCEDRGMRPHVLTRFSRQLGDRGLDIEGSGRRAVLKGYTVKPQEVPVDEGSGAWGAALQRARF